MGWITNPNESMKIVKGRFRLTRFCMKRIFLVGGGEGDGADVVPNFIKKKIHKENGKVKCIYIYILLLHNNH